MQTSCNPIFPRRQVRLTSTAKPITPFGGLVSLIAFFEQIRLAGQISALMPFTYTSPNAIPPAQTLVAFMISVVAGARRLAHTDWLRADKALHALLGIERFPGTDTVRNLFLRFRQGHIEEFWRPLWKWLFALSWPMPPEGFSLDLDSTVFQRSGNQEGANTFNQCYADSPTRAGFLVTKPHQSFMQCRVYYSRWAENHAGAGFLIEPAGIHGNYFGNALFSQDGHRLAKVFDSDLRGATILGTTAWGVEGGMENRITSGAVPAFTPDRSQWAWGPIQHPPLHLDGTAFRLTRQTEIPGPDDGLAGEVRWVDAGGNSALWVKTPEGWKKSALT